MDVETLKISSYGCKRMSERESLGQMISYDLFRKSGLIGKEPDVVNGAGGNLNWRKQIKAIAIN